MSRDLSLAIRPYQLLCLVCRQGRRDPAARYPHEARLDAIQAAVQSDPLVPVVLRCNTRSVFRCQNPGRRYDTPEGPRYNDLRDLTVLQRLGHVPGAMRPACEFFRQLPEAVPDVTGVCGFPVREAPSWPRCPFADSGNYRRGLAAGLARFVPERPPAERRAIKKASAAACRSAARLRIRPHHLLCLHCFHAGRTPGRIAPIPQDNLAECIAAMRRHPDLPVELVEGPCMICPPCSAYYAPSHVCLGGGSMSLRDERKDLDTLRRLGLQYGDVLPARELLRRVGRAIRRTTDVCGYGDGLERAREWRVCGGPRGKPGYVRARRAGLGVPGVAEPGTPAAHVAPGAARA